ncbi:uncharacterized protein EI90DRAFT_2836875, partial [Cantharellus anzutake]|uniref:uncharacterized protein n=1 Tax=Cantharellus anzutake TaxID=1750568 RepID=UPI001904445C
SFRMMWKFAKYFAYGSTCLAVTLYISWRGVHQWVERYELASSPHSQDPYEWDKEGVRWTGQGQKGGTDPRLGWRGRSLVRGAWMALNWGSGLDSGVIDATSTNPDAPIFDRRLATALYQISTAVRIAKGIPVLNRSDGTMDPTMLDLRTIEAGVLERIGRDDTLEAAKAAYEELQSAYMAEKRVPEAARTAVKIGDVTARLGDVEEALTWWKNALELSGHSYPVSTDSTSTSATPYVQRTLTSAIISLSGYLSATRDLQNALALQVRALNILPHFLSPFNTPMSPATIDQVLHELHLTHRAAVIQTHLAEVLYALRTPSSTGFFTRSKDSGSSAPITTPLALLQNAASKIEHIIQVLTSPTSNLKSLPPLKPSSLPLLPIFSTSRSLAYPSTTLLRQSKRSTTYALNLTALLLEELHKYEESLEDFERALAWAGGVEGYDEEVLEREWKSVWKGYVRVRERV